MPSRCASDGELVICDIVIVQEKAQIKRSDVQAEWDLHHEAKFPDSMYQRVIKELGTASKGNVWSLSAGDFG